jgi:MFS family permease
MTDPLPEIGVHRRALAVGLVMATSLVAFETTALLTALPTVSEELNGDTLYGATLAAYMLANIVGLIVVGEQVDRRGPRLPFVSSLIVFSIGLVVAGAANSMWIVLLGRVLQGAGAGGVAPLAYAVVNRVWPSDRQARIFAWVSAAWILPSLVAPLIAGWLTSEASWRWVFIGMLPLVGITVFVTAPAMAGIPIVDRDDRDSTRVLMAVRLAAGVGAVVAGVQNSRWWVAVALVVIGLALAVPAYRLLMPTGSLRARPGLSAIIATRTMATAAFLGVDSFVPLAADRIHGASATAQGFVIIGAALTWSLGSWLATMRTHVPLHRSARLGMGLIVSAVIATTPVLDADWPLVATFFTWSLAGLGMGLFFVPTSVAAMKHAEPGRDGIIGSQVNLADSLGFALMGGVGGATVAVSDRTSWPLTSALFANFAIAALIGVLGIVVSRGVTRAPRCATITG